MKGTLGFILSSGSSLRVIENYQEPQALEIPVQEV